MEEGEEKEVEVEEEEEEEEEAIRTITKIFMSYRTD